MNGSGKSKDGDPSHKAGTLLVHHAPQVMTRSTPTTTESAPSTGVTGEGNQNLTQPDQVPISKSIRAESDELTRQGKKGTGSEVPGRNEMSHDEDGDRRKGDEDGGDENQSNNVSF